MVSTFFGTSALAEGAKGTYRNSLGLLYRFTSTPLLDITQQQIVNFRLSRLDQGLKRTTLNKDLRAFSKFYGWLCDNNYRQTNPTDGIKAYSIKRSEKIKIRYITHEQALDLIDQPLRPKIMDPSKLRIRDHAILATLYYSGMRTSEVSGLIWDHINLEEKSIFIATTKTHDPRVVHIPLQLVKILDYHGQHNGKEGYVFNAKGGSRISTQSIRYTVDKYVEQLGIRAKGESTRITPVVLRHSYATYLTEKGVSMITLGKQMGNPTAVDRYAHATEKAQKRAAELFD